MRVRRFSLGVTRSRLLPLRPPPSREILGGRMRHGRESSGASTFNRPTMMATFDLRDRRGRRGIARSGRSSTILDHHRDELRSPVTRIDHLVAPLSPTSALLDALRSMTTVLLPLIGAHHLLTATTTDLGATRSAAVTRGKPEREAQVAAAEARLASAGGSRRVGLDLLLVVRMNSRKGEEGKHRDTRVTRYQPTAPL